MHVISNGNSFELDIESDTQIPEGGAALTKEAARTPGLLAKYGQFAAELRAAQEQMKFKLDEVSSFVADTARKETTEKLTEARLKEITALSPQVQEAKDQYIRTLRDYHAVENSLKSLYKKCDVITTLLYQQRQELKAYGSF